MPSPPPELDLKFIAFEDNDSTSNEKEFTLTLQRNSEFEEKKHKFRLTMLSCVTEDDKEILETALDILFKGFGNLKGE